MAVKKANVIKEIKELRNSYDRKYQPVERDYLAEMIEDINGLSDQDVQKFLVLNADDMYNVLGPSVNKMPNTSKIMRGDIPNPRPNLDKVLGNGWDKDDKFYNTSVHKLQGIADEQGMDLAALLDQMRQEKTSRDRYDILHGKNEDSGLKEDLQAIFMDLFQPAQQRVFEEGRDPTWKEVGADAVRNATYAIPANYFSQGIATGAKAALGGAAAAPIIENVTDAALGVKDIGDAAIGAGAGTITNMIAPYLVGSAGRMLNRYANNSGVGRYINDLANPDLRTGRQVKQKYIDKAKMYKQYADDIGSIDIDDRAIVKSMKDPVYGRDKMTQELGKDNKMQLKHIMTGKGDDDLGVIYQPGHTSADKISNWQKKHKDIVLDNEDVDMVKKAFDEWPLEEQILESRNIMTPAKAIAKDMAAQNIVNRIGESWYNDGKILPKVPYLGKYLAEKAKESQEEADYRKRMDEAIASLIERDLLYGRLTDEQRAEKFKD